MADVKFVAITPPGQSSESLVSGLFGTNGSLDLGAMLNTAFIVAINVGAILAMMRIMWAGWLYMGSADMWSNKHHAKEVFQDAIIGLLLLLAVWIILNQINPDILNIGSLGGSTSSAASSQTGASQFTGVQNPTYDAAITNNNGRVCMNGVCQ